jgi:hypothetical protein
MINEVPTVYEVVTGNAEKQTQEMPSSAHQNGNRSKSNSKMVSLMLSFNKIQNINYELRTNQILY